MYVRLTSLSYEPPQASAGRIQGLTLDATDDEVREFLAEWHAEEIRELARLN